MRGMHFPACHRCLVPSFGINNIDLVPVSETVRLYWIHGRYSGMIRAFITIYNGFRMCRISTKLTEAYTIDYSTLHVSHHLVTKVELNIHDENIRLFATSMVFEQTFVETYARTLEHRQLDLEKSSFRRKQELTIPVLFGRYFTDKLR